MFCLAVSLVYTILMTSAAFAAEQKGLIHTIGGKNPAVSASAPAPAPIGDKWAIVIGINSFKDSRIPTLKYAAKDAEDFARFLVDKENFARDHVLLLTNESATEDSILDAIGDNWLPRRAFPNDLVLVFISSHGSPKEVDVAGENFLVAHDTKIDRLFSSGIKLEDLAPTIRKRTGCHRIILILDACNSGAADVTTSKGLVRNLNFDLDSLAGEGLIVISSSRADQRSWESARYTNGVFTKRLMEALQSNGSATTVAQAFNILNDRVQEEVRFDRKAFQQPLMKSRWTGPELVLAMRPTHPRTPMPEIDDHSPTSASPAVPGSSSATPQVPSTASTLQTAISSLPADNPAVQTSMNSVMLGAPTQSSVAGQPWLGVLLDGLTEDRLRTMGLPSSTKGTVISQVEPSSGAAKGGLQIGDLIQTINGAPVNSPLEVQQQVRSRKIGDQLVIGAIRSGAANAFVVTLGDLKDAPPVVAQPTNTLSTIPLGGSPTAIPPPGAQPIQGSVQKNVQALPTKVAILPFAPPDNFNLTKSNDYPRNFTDSDRTTVSTLAVLMSERIIDDLSRKLSPGTLVPAQNIRDSVMQMQGVNLNAQAPMQACNLLGSSLGARYIVVTKINKFSFNARVMWSNEYSIKTVTQILDAQTGQVIATIPKSIMKTPWLQDSAVWFTEYLDKQILPEFCRQLAQDISRKLPIK